MGVYVMSKTFWVRMRGSYYSNHVLTNYNGQIVPSYCISKAYHNKGWDISYFNVQRGVYVHVKELKPMKTLKEAKRYIDVDVKNFDNLK